MSSDFSPSTPPTTYYPPSFDVLANFAQTVCQALGPEYADPEVVRGFADFIDTLARIHANNLNRASQPAADEQAA